MPLDLPKLDDRTFADLLDEALSILPQYAPEWTNHNASDPGITLVELLAYFTEILLYRADRVSRESRINFLKLLCGPDAASLGDLNGASLREVTERLQSVAAGLRRPERAVTAEDFAQLAQEATEGQQMPERRAGRVLYVPSHDLDAEEDNRMGHASLVVVPQAFPKGSRPAAEDLAAMLSLVRDHLEPRRLLATRLHFSGPRFLWLSLSLEISPLPGMSFAGLRQEVKNDVEGYFSSFSGGGPEGDGWPFGRSVYLSEIFERIEGVRGIDFVAAVRVTRLSTDMLDDDGSALGVQIGICSTVGKDTRIGGGTGSGSERFLCNAIGRLSAVVLRPYELARVTVAQEDIRRADSSAPKAFLGEWS
jgi:hypothetical protein